MLVDELNCSVWNKERGRADDKPIGFIGMTDESTVDLLLSFLSWFDVCVEYLAE